MFELQQLLILTFISQGEGHVKTCSGALDTFCLVCGVQYEVQQTQTMHHEYSCLLRCSNKVDCVGYDFSDETCTFFKGERNDTLPKRSIKLRSQSVRSSDKTCFPNPCLNNGKCNKTCGCECKAGFTGERCEIKTECSQVFARGVHTLGSEDGFRYQAYCDQGWTYVIRRMDGSQDFNLNWEDYKYGFGDLNGEFWVGNEVLHRLTSRNKYQMKLEYILWGFQESYFATYENFRVDNEGNLYRISFTNYNGNHGAAPDVLANHKNMAFSTRDKDHDKVWGSCANQLSGGFWYKTCNSGKINPTGVYKNAGQNCIFVKGPWWYAKCLSYISMKIKIH